MQEKIFKVKTRKEKIISSIDFHFNLAKLDAVKTYMSLRRVPNNLEDRVIRWLVGFILFDK